MNEVKVCDLSREDVMVLMVVLNPKSVGIYDSWENKTVSLDDIIDEEKARELGVLQLTSTIMPEKLKYPEGWYWNTKNGLTNKHNSSNGVYSTIRIKKIK